jgi:3-dehydroquinate synthase
MKTISSKLQRQSSCSIYCGIDVKKNFSKILKKLKPTQVIVIYDSGLKKQTHNILKTLKDFNVKTYGLPAKENTKNLSEVLDIYKKLSGWTVDRKSVLVSIGGGVIGDAVGFVASTYLRGVPWINIPTTVLSQVDSSLGGKNGVNLPDGKNLVGSFYQPHAVLIDFAFLKSLPEREIISGLGEILKYSYINPRIAFPVFEPKKYDQKKMLKTIEKLTPHCVNQKMKLVGLDEQDRKGIRQVLNLGHTFGHVLETYTQYKQFKHGEAVIWGLKFAAIVSLMKELMSFEEFREIMNLANKLMVPSLPGNLNPEKCYKLALKDKKSENNQIKMVLFQKRGKVLSNQDVSREVFKKAVEVIKDMS